MVDVLTGICGIDLRGCVASRYHLLGEAMATASLEDTKPQRSK